MRQCNKYVKRNVEYKGTEVVWYAMVDDMPMAACGAHAIAWTKL
uniref:Desulfoferrodoxin n=1 Tax=Heterorhabditis bacteriophora TaxID=37862 RepID=A0A1I7WYP4_HETBA